MTLRGYMVWEAVLDMFCDPIFGVTVWHFAHSESDGITAKTWMQAVISCKEIGADQMPLTFCRKTKQNEEILLSFLDL